MNAYKRILSLILALLCCVGVLAGCKKENPEDKVTETYEQKETEAPTDPKLVSSLASSYDFKNEEFTILTRKQTDYEFKGKDDEKATFLEREVFERNEYVMEKCKVEFEIVTRMGGWDDRQIFTSAVRQDSAGAATYELVSGHSAVMAALALEGLGYDLSKLPNIELEKRWWSEAYYNTANYNGALYTALGDIDYSLYEYMMVFFFNEGLAADYKLEDLYELALDGDWTFAKLQEYTSMVTTNLDLAEDQQYYGFLANGHGCHSFVDSFGLELIKKEGDEEQRTISGELNDDNLVTPMQKTIDFIWENLSVRSDFTSDNSIETQTPIFTGGRALFYQQQLGQAVRFKSENMTNYGVLPYPKYDENQVNYRTTYRDTVSAILVPAKVKNPTMAGTVTEMLCWQSYHTVTQQYYEETLKYQAFDNPDCVETLEMIRASVAPSFATIYGGVFANPPKSILGNVIQSKGTQNLSSYWAGLSGDWISELATFYTKMDALAEKNAG